MSCQGHSGDMQGVNVADGNSAKAYFGLAPELVHGIHMAPITPATLLIRPRAFVKEEWDKFFSNGKANVDGEKDDPLARSYITSAKMTSVNASTWNKKNRRMAICPVCKSSYCGCQGQLWVFPRWSQRLLGRAVDGRWGEPYVVSCVGSSAG